MKAVLPGIAGLVLAACTTSPTQQAEIGFPKGSLGYSALVHGNVAKAEMQLMQGAVDADEPARLLNLAQVYRMTDRPLQARDLYNRVLERDDHQLVLSDGRVLTAHEIARLGLSAEMSAAMTATEQN